MSSFAYDKPLAGCTVAIAGLGLMGGSLGLALRGRVQSVLGIARRAETVEQALAIGAIDDGASDLSAAGNADLIVLATPVSIILRQIGEVGALARQGRLRDGVVLTDMGSTKAAICDAMARLPASVQPVGGHPMCGKETSGLDVAESSLYRDAPFILCPLPGTQPQATALAAALAQAIGACPLELDPLRHDRLAAAISHVPYLASAALFAAAAEQADGDETIWQLAAGGFRSTTRLAGSDPLMMADILHSNRAAVLEHIDRLRSQLDQLASLVAGDDDQALRQALQSIQARRQAFIDQHGA
ncbi:MAG: prephenate dehydrogenase [Caldilineales bacterium]